MNNVYRLLMVALVSAALARPSVAQIDGESEVPDVGNSPEWIIAIHGGAGSTTRDELSAAAEEQLRVDLMAALEAGAALLDAGASGPEAIEAALKILEDSPHFNAGRGAALDEHGRARHDASIMRGNDLSAGAIAGSSRIKNPIAAARAVMEQTQNVMLHGEGADWFAAEAGLDIADPLYFVTEKRRKALQKQRAKNPDAETVANPYDDGTYGTVGAVVLDRDGNISAGTTTGGRTNKRYGRIGDTPIIGAGTYASNSSCAVSATGHGEYFMRWTVTRDICARVEFGGETLEAASRELLIDTLLPQGGTGGVVALDPAGNVVFVMTTANLKRGVMSSSTPARVAVYSNEKVR
ncbi:MAG: isoaspartyl peptidase/L-asparaginase [Woeseiaceae bacterium]|nr:isoaspartyl peptidase/L-asparaginase [Woeseiaceae bacterium]